MGWCVGEVEKMSKKMQEVEECEVPVVHEDYLGDARKGAALLKIPSHTISSWGAPRHSLPSAAEDMTDFGNCSFKSAGVVYSVQVVACDYHHHHPQAPVR